MMMCFVVVYKCNHIIYQGMQIDDGAAALEYAKSKGAKVRIWEMYGLNHVWELPSETREEIKDFTKSLQ